MHKVEIATVFIQTEELSLKYFHLTNWKQFMYISIDIIIDNDS